MISSILTSIKGIIEIYRSLKSLVEIYQKEVKEQFYQQAFKTVEEIKNAKSDEERAALAKKLAEGGLFK